MSSEDEKLRLSFTDEQWLEIEVQAAVMKMDAQEYLRMILKEGIAEMKGEPEPVKTLH
ncbi:hypothetical protein SAMN04490182_2080 [Pseudomonas cedrina]|uniref:CopG family transcriptional regulator n=1 Tax=Pseudomonas cedrina TaxID=651740 RepID=A0ABY0UGW4_PSECE|nr:hypothetical protein [Pseudomonas cedrina]SDS66471.1 hypothetical protein SAMN04490182_2080 [Pseudomonas cedrina]